MNTQMPKLESTTTKKTSAFHKNRRRSIWMSLRIIRSVWKGYQIEQRSSSPAAGSIIAFLRRPPIKRSTNEIFIDTSNGGFPINQNPPSHKPIFFQTQTLGVHRATNQETDPKTKPHEPNTKTHPQKLAEMADEAQRTEENPINKGKKRECEERKKRI